MKGLKMKFPRLDTKSIRNSSIVQWYKGIISSSLFASFIIKTISLIIVWACALIPIWVYMFVRWLIGPADFWQEFAIFAVAAIGIGWAQIILAIVGFVFSMIILVEDV